MKNLVGFIRISNSSDSEEEMIVHLSDGIEEAECLYCCLTGPIR
jgi:hypothetical protein